MSEIQSYTYINQNEQIPLVDIIMFAYNHEEFIEEAIKSVLMQKTKYSYKIEIGEDCSTDHTRQIIMDYYERYPERIELFLWKENVGGDRNTIEIIKKCRGTYIAFLEGDDCWTDSFKLEKQISFLENHENYIGTAHNVRCVNKRGELLHRDFELYSICEGHIYGKEQAERFEMAAQTTSLLFRNIWKSWTVKELEAFFMSTGNGDMKINILLGLSGDINYFKDIMADHRRVFEGDSWTAKSHDKNMMWFHYMTCCSIQNHMKKYKNISLDVDKRFDSLLEESYMKLLCKWNKENLSNFLKFFKRKLAGRIDEIVRKSS